MKFNKIIFLGVILFSLLLLAYCLKKEEAGPDLQEGEKFKRVDVTNFFHTTNFSFNGEQFVTDPVALECAAEMALWYLNRDVFSGSERARPWTVFDKKIFSNEKVRDTLEFIISTIKEDRRKKVEYRILDPNFLNKNFNFIKWNGDVNSAHKNKVFVPKGNIRLTSYAIFEVDGSYSKDKDHSCALYSIINKEFSKDSRLKYSRKPYLKHNKKNFLKYTKQEVLAGALDNSEDKNKVKPLVWLSRDGLEDALMQGSVLVNMPDGKRRLFNVHRNNGFSYVQKIKDPKKQKRYWYFKEINKEDFSNSNVLYSKHSGAVFAGDVCNIGFGKLIAVRYTNTITNKDEVRLGVLADTGGAFVNNLYQLDSFRGIFDSKDKFKAQIRKTPDCVEAYILVKS